MITRRSFFHFIVAILIACCCRVDWTFGQENARPNFLFIVTDDQRWDAMSCVQKEQGERARFPWFTTPNMDRLAREGMRFRNAFVVNSLCSPSRSCFLTGRYSHMNGVANNRTPFPADSVTHATVLHNAGYVTGYFGKWHHGTQPERPGFDQFASFIGQGKYVDCPVNINGTITPSEGWIDDVTTDHAIRFLRENKDKSFDMVVGYKSPHDPRMPPERAKDRFAGKELRPAPNLEVAPPYHHRQATKANARKGNGEGIRNYFRCISAADDCLGRLLDALDELKLSDNTVVVFTSDNGYFLGEHSLGDKRGAYEESMRIPLIVRYPKLIKPGSVRDEMVLNIDLAPTIIDLAGLEARPSMPGATWRGLFSEPRTARVWRTSFFYEYFYEKPFATPTLTAVRTETAKIIKYPGHDDWTEVYDLKNDPYELKNLARDAGQAELVKQLEQLHKSLAQQAQYQTPSGLDPQPADFDQPAKP